MKIDVLEPKTRWKALKALQASAAFPWIVWIFGATFYCYEYFLRIQPSMMSADLMSTYHLDGAGFGNLVAFYYYAYTPMQIFVGILMDRYAPRLLLSYAILCCAIGSLLFATTDHLWVAQVGRFLVGFGSAFAFVGVLKIATIWLPPNRFAIVAGSTTTLGMIGAMLGDNLLAVMVRDIGWRGTIYISVVFGFLLAFVIWVVVRNAQGRGRQQMHQHTLTMREVFTGLGHVLKNKQIWIGGIVGFLLYLSLSTFAELWLVPYLEQARGLSTTVAAAATSMLFLGWAVGGPVVGFISDTIKRRRSPMIIGSLVAGFCSLWLIYTTNLPVDMIYVSLVLMGIGCSAQNMVFVTAREN
ncbi:MAG: MFS transporter, partial [Gammaproteobacteria bacterium]|nr:MFS transporter [Gammaproteobacteria bacterium]